MGTYRWEDKLKQIVRTLLELLGITAINLQLGGVASAQQPGVGVHLLIPSATYSDTFTSSLIIQNMSAFSNSIDINAYDSSGNPLGTLLRINLPRGGRFRSSNILKDLGAALGSFGPIRVRSSNNQTLSAISEVRSSQGFGGFFSGVSVSATWTWGSILDVIDDGPRGTPETFRTNLGLNSVGPGSASVTITLYNDSGGSVGAMTTTLVGNGLTQLNGIVQQLRGQAAVTRGYLSINSSQPIIAWASKIDNATDDPSFQIAVEGPSIPISQNWMTSSLSAEVAQDFFQSIKHWDWTGGESAMKRALDVDSNNVDARCNLAVLLMAQGRLAEALSEIQIAEQLDPLSQQVQSTFGKILFNAGKPDDATLRLKRAIERDASNAQAHHHLGQIYEQTGKYSEALAIYDKARMLRGNSPDSPRFRALQAGVYARMGKRMEAKRMLDGIRSTPAASAHAYLGDKDEAFRLLFKMVEEREPHVISLKSDPQFSGLHSDPRWRELLRRMNLPAE